MRRIRPRLIGGVHTSEMQTTNNRILTMCTHTRTRTSSSPQAGACIVFVVSVATALLLGELFLFHCVLIARGMTTYEYIINERQRMSPVSSSNSLVRSQSRRNSNPGNSSGGEQRAGVGGSAAHVATCFCDCGASNNRVVPEGSSSGDQRDQSRRRRVRINPCMLMKSERSAPDSSSSSGRGGADASISGKGKDPTGDRGEVNGNGTGIDVEMGCAVDVPTTNGCARDDVVAGQDRGGDPEGQSSATRQLSGTDATSVNVRNNLLPPLSHTAANGTVEQEAPSPSRGREADRSSSRTGGDQSPPPRAIPSCSPSKTYEVSDAVSPQKTRSPDLENAATVVASPLHWPATAEGNERNPKDEASGSRAGDVKMRPIDHRDVQSIAGRV